MATTLKLIHGGNAQFVTLESADFSSADFAIRSLLPESDGWSAKYTDEEGDLCILEEATWQDFLETARASSDDGALRLELTALSGAPSVGSVVGEFECLDSEADSEGSSQCSGLSKSSWQIVAMEDIADDGNSAGAYEGEGIASATSAASTSENEASDGGPEEAQTKKDKRAAVPGEKGGVPATKSVGWLAYTFRQSPPQESVDPFLADPVLKAEQSPARASTEEESAESSESRNSCMTIVNCATVRQQNRSTEGLQMEREPLEAPKTEDYDLRAEKMHEGQLKGLRTQSELRVNGFMLVEKEKGINELEGDSVLKVIPRQASAPQAPSEMSGALSPCEEEYADHGIGEEARSAHAPYNDHEAGTQVHVGVTCDCCEATPIIGPRFKCENCHDYDLCGSCHIRCTECHDADHHFQCILQPRRACTQVHKYVTCDGCGVAPIVGPRFKCETCADYDLCGACYSKRAELHNPEHKLKCLTHERKSWEEREQLPQSNLWALMLPIGALAALFGPGFLLACPLVAFAAKRRNECDKHRRP